MATFTKKDIGKSALSPAAKPMFGKIEAVKNGYAKLNGKWIPDWMIEKIDDKPANQSSWPSDIGL